jgi:predicted ATPase
MVAVGANGSGKSNLIKSLDFVGSIAREGLDATVRAHGAVEGIVPKSIPVQNVRDTTIVIEYRMTLPSLFGVSGEGPRMSCEHRLELVAKNNHQVAFGHERLTFFDPLYAQEFISRRHVLSHSPPPTYTRSRLIIERDRFHRFAVTTDPPMTADTIDRYLGWFGLPFLAEALKKNEAISAPADALATILDELSRQRALTRPNRVLSSLLDPGGTSMIAFASEASALQTQLASIRKYDIHLAELRQQQTITAPQEITPDGRGMPAALRFLKNANAWQRLAATLRDIAPHIVDASVNQLRSGEEFVQFVETRTGRRVESWHASDGTLRALAILLALETHVRGVLLIEEPEQGLHPWAVRTLISHIRDVIKERNIQVVITTHSQQVLDSVEPAEVVLSMRSPTEGSKLTALSDVCQSQNIGLGDVGRLWVNGLLGAVPTYEFAE